MCRRRRRLPPTVRWCRSRFLGQQASNLLRMLKPLRPAGAPPDDLLDSRADELAGVDEGARNGLDLLIARHALQHAATSDADAAWLEVTAQKLRSALIGYGLQGKITGTRLTPNAALVRFMGSDTLRVEDLEKRRAVLLTTHGLRLVGITPLPGENRRGRRNAPTDRSSRSGMSGPAAS